MIRVSPESNDTASSSTVEPVGDTGSSTTGRSGSSRISEMFLTPASI